ncbi:unnamed protein product [Chondrus crispus]|uniref:Uncharacterized protein n=1 Tax=Chondrus crispus TaxID=2769 RepID=R7Q7Y6_CHOCR|nr:unnamed protein product [Chondrus crispus]CDF33933.1 unnamed protein product [Chondrus crispus]|eukprot:XP_005713752.1 unnamed protein product [Chondrus crispus]
MSLHGDEASAPLINRVKQHAVLKFERGPAQAVHVRDVAKAMVADGINNAKKVELSDIEFRFRKRQYDLIEYWGEDIVWMATERRDAQKRAWRRRKEEREGKRVSEYAKVEGGVQSEWSEGSASVQGGGGGDVVDGYAQGVPYEQDMPGESERSGDSSEGGSTDVGIDRLSQQRLGNPPDVRARAAVRNAGSLPIGSVESLAHQLAQSPVKIRDNELLPDVELSEASRRESSVEKVAPALYDTTNWEQEVLEQEREAHREYGDEGNVLEDLALYSTASGEDVDGLPPPEGIQLPDYAPLTGGMAGEDRFSDESFDPTQDFPERDSYVSYASYAAGRVPEEEIISRYRPDLQPDEAQLEATFEEDPRNNRRFRQSTRAEDMPSRRRRKESVRSQNQVDSAAPMQRFSALVSRILAATDRPSQRRQRRARVVEVEDTELDMLDQGFDGFYDPPLRGNGDMREAGNVDI